MPDDLKPIATATPAPPWMMEPTPDQVQKLRDQQWGTRELAAHDAARTAMGTVDLVATTSFMVVDDENPDGRLVNIGDKFTISEFDLPRYLGKGLPAMAGSPADQQG